MNCDGSASLSLFLIIILKSVGFCEAQTIQTAFYNDTVLYGERVELHIISYSPKEFISIICGVNSDIANYGFISMYDKGKKTLIPMDLTSEYTGRVSIKKSWITVISNTTFRDEGRYFYCTMAVNISNKVVQHHGFRHQLKKVQAKPRSVGKVLESSTQAQEKRSLVLQCHFEGRPLLNASWSGPLSKVGTQNTTVRMTNLLHHVTVSLYISSVEAAFDTLTGFCSTMNQLGSDMQWTRLNVAYVPKNTSLIVTQRLQDRVVHINVSCRAIANPKPTKYLFYRNGVLDEESQQGVYLFESSNCTSITVKCVPVNAIGTGEQTSSTVFTTRLPSIIPLKMKITIEEGQTLSILCLANGCPTPEILWYREREFVGKQSNLKIKDITPQLQGNYTCVARNQFGSSNRSIYVEIWYKPRNTILTVSQDRRGNDINATIHCQARANPRITHFLFYRDRVFVENSTSGTSLFFTSHCIVSNFTCIPVNDIGKGQPALSTVTNSRPASILSLPRKSTLKKNQTMSISCQADGCPTPEVRWFKQNKLVGVQSNLTLNPVKPEDQGNFTCLATNQFGSAKASTLVEICCKEEAINTKSSSSGLLVSVVVSCSIALLLASLCIIFAWKKLKRTGQVLPREEFALGGKVDNDNLLLQKVATTNDAKT